jgi:hypothetical protein
LHNLIVPEKLAMKQAQAPVGIKLLINGLNFLNREGSIGRRPVKVNEKPEQGNPHLLPEGFRVTNQNGDGGSAK